MVQRKAARFVKSVPHRRTKPTTSVSTMVSDLGWEPLQTCRFHDRLNMFFQDHSRHGCTPCGVPSSPTAPAGSSRSFSAIPASSAVCTCLQVCLLSKNHPGLECSLPVELVEAESLEAFKLRLQSLQHYHVMCIYCTNCFSALVPV